jgi:hypothetical protein
VRNCTSLLICACAVAVVGSGASRVNAGALSPNNILVMTENFGSAASDTVREYTPGGTLVQTFNVSWPGSSRPVTEDVRDTVVDPLGQVRIYNGTFTPVLTTLTPSTTPSPTTPASGSAASPKSASAGSRRAGISSTSAT